MDNLGRIIMDLRPSILGQQVLWTTLKWQGYEFVQSAELALDWQMNVADAVPLSEPSATAIFRIFQERLINVARHAQASRVAVVIIASSAEISNRVQDDGRGAGQAAFDSPNAYGVMGLRERARHLGRCLVISRKIGSGSTTNPYVLLQNS